MPRCRSNRSSNRCWDRTEITRTVAAELAQGVLADRVPGFLAEIAVHVVRRIVDTGLSLDGCAASGVDDAAADAGGTAAVESLDDSDRCPLVQCLDSGGSACATKTHHGDIRLVVPVVLARILHHLRRLETGPPRLQAAIPVPDSVQHGPVCLQSSILWAV
jgi:hypothetical protein